MMYALPSQQHTLVFSLWKRGAYLGDPWCTYSVANAYEEGIGVEKGISVDKW